MLGGAAIVEVDHLMAKGTRDAFSQTKRKFTKSTPLVNNNTGRPRAPNLERGESNRATQATRRNSRSGDHIPGEDLVNQVSETVGENNENETKSAAQPKGLTQMSGGSGMAAHGISGMIGTAIQSGVSVKTAKIQSEAAQKVSENALAGVKETNQTNKDIAIMQNNANIETQSVHGNAAASDTPKINSSSRE